MSRKRSGKSPIFHVKYMVTNPVGEAKEDSPFCGRHQAAIGVYEHGGVLIADPVEPSLLSEVMASSLAVELSNVTSETGAEACLQRNTPCEVPQLRKVITTRKAGYYEHSF